MSRKRKKNDKNDDNGFAAWGGYMEAKKSKLSEQFKMISSNIKKKSNIFAGVSIMVNGYTKPSADELKFMIAEHGGTYHLYLNQKKPTTHIIASNLPNIKINQGSLPVVYPKWITDSIEQNKLLDFKPYILYGNQSKTQKKLVFAKTATDEHFISEFYKNSRLHLISTLGSEFKSYVNELRINKSNSDFPGVQKLKKGNHSANYDSLIMHIDMDCFFVSVGLRNRPELRGKPVAVTHSKSESKTSASMAEVASCSYEARKFRVRNGMFVGEARKLCPDLVPIPYEFEAYRETAKTLYDTIAEYTLDIEAVSCDEMYVDVAPILNGARLGAEEFGRALREEVRARTGCGCSCGFGANRLQARMATKKAKPDGQFLLEPEFAREYFRGIKSEELPGVGWSLGKKLEKLGLATCGDIQEFNLDKLVSELGQKTAQLIYDSSRGIDNKPLNFNHERKSVSADVNYGIRFRNDSEATKFLENLSKEVHSRLTELKMRSKCLTLKILIRAPDAPIETPKYLGCGKCDSISRSTTVTRYLDTPEAIFKEAKGIYTKLDLVPEDLRGVGIQLSKLEKFEDAKPNKILDKFLTTTNTRLSKPKQGNNLNNYFKSQKSDLAGSKKTFENNKKNPVDVDLETLKELPEEIQKEIIHEYNLDINSGDKSLGKKIETKPKPEKLEKRTKSFRDLNPEQLRVLLRNWIEFETEPNEIDISMLGDYLKTLTEPKHLGNLLALIKFIYRNVSKMSCLWHKTYFKLIGKVQEGMTDKFGKRLAVPREFSCDKLCNYDKNHR